MERSASTELAEEPLAQATASTSEPHGLAAPEDRALLLSVVSQ